MVVSLILGNILRYRTLYLKLCNNYNNQTLIYLLIIVEFASC